MKIHFGWSWKVTEKSWKMIFLKEWSPCKCNTLNVHIYHLESCYIVDFLNIQFFLLVACKWHKFALRFPFMPLLPTVYTIYVKQIIIIFVNMYIMHIQIYDL